MLVSQALQYGTCPCGGEYENRYVEINMTVEGGAIKFRDESQGACPKCGSRVYKAEMLERIEATMNAEKLDRRLNRDH